MSMSALLSNGCILEFVSYKGAVEDAHPPGTGDTSSPPPEDSGLADTGESSDTGESTDTGEGIDTGEGTDTAVGTDTAEGSDSGG
jgi:hypothetical protein